MACEFCDSCGGEKTYKHQVCMALYGVVRGIDYCIHQIVAALNAGGVYTTSSCCGHGEKNGEFILENGRVLIILPKAPESKEAWDKVIRS